ncbi:MAG TPA: hydrogenase [Planctomycetaceae bacterium]|nr:hydrogenase [Planctomycetaceae bacterium]
MSTTRTLAIPNGHAFAIADCPVLPIETFRQEVIDGVAAGARLSALFAFPADSGCLRLLAALSRADQGDVAIASAEVRDEYPAITPECPQAHLHEREIFEQWNVRPIGHPWLKPVRGMGARREAAPAVAHDGATEFFQMEGDEVHEVAVGPVHAGIIEPGHFRFQCHGETVYHLEIALGYQHRGVERAMVGGPTPRAIHYMETLAGDSTAGHATAYCRAVEAVSATRVPARGQFLRGVTLELERVANHIGDLGAMAGDVGFLPTMAYCGRIRGDVLNLTAMLCGNRFGRGMIRPGGVAFDLDARVVEELRRRLDLVASDARSAVELMWNTPSVMARFDGVGVVPLDVCRQLGLVGVAARACGAPRDVRDDFPYGIYRFTHIPISTWNTGDVFARAYVRWSEVKRSLAFIREQLDALPGGRVIAPSAGPLAANRAAVTLIEGWRGEICHVALTDGDGRFASYKVVDPSFHNWFGLAMALRNQEISDFPLCNKSFNLSYCGHDL